MKKQKGLPSPKGGKGSVTAVKSDRKGEVRIYGKHACLSVFKTRRQAIVRVYISPLLVNDFAQCLKFCANQKIAYHVVQDGELSRVTASDHHEGICFIIKRKPELSEREFFDALNSRDQKTAAMYLYLDGLTNPHNLGSIARIAAHFGVNFIIGNKDLPRFSAAATRIAEGGAESVTIVRSEEPRKLLRKLVTKGFRVVASSTDRGSSLYKHDFSKSTVLVVGSERYGVSREVEREATDLITIPGSGAVQSLNVSAATAIILSEWSRQNSAS